jgi:uncharacterized membrane protein YkvI
MASLDSHKTKTLYAVGLGLLLSDIIPTPADAFYFYKQRENKQKLEESKITPKQYWTREAIGYYGLNALWWSSVLGVSYLAGKSYEQKRNIFISLVVGGAVFGVIYKNIKKDEQFYAQNGK